jgi:hypothetical protein
MEYLHSMWIPYGIWGEGKLLTWSGSWASKTGLYGGGMKGMLIRTNERDQSGREVRRRAEAAIVGLYQ